MEYRKLVKLSVNLLLLAYIRNFLVVAIADERLLRDGTAFPSHQGENLSGGILELENNTQGDGRLHSSSRPVVFEPASLDFGSQHVGMPAMHTVRIGNPNRVQTLQLTSISSDSSDFHTSFFRSKIVKGGEWTSFNVVFLARTVGPVRSKLYISTSLGTFDYKVEGIGDPNPFRLRSLLGARIPVNATYSPLISMYNPFSTSMQVTEMYSSGGDLHLELLTGQPQGSKNLWEIKPYETKAIARANFYGRASSNHTSYIRIKTDAVEGGMSVVLPVEVEVSDPGGLFLSRELLDFGILKSGESKTLPLYVLNSGFQQVYVKQVAVEPSNPALSIDYMTTLLKPGSKYTKVAMITFDTKLVNASALMSGKIIVSTEDKDKRPYQLEISYEANVLYGSLSYNRNQTLFRLGRSPFEPIIREISLSNQFDDPLVLYDIRIPTKAQDFFSVIHFNSPYIIPPSSQWHKPFAIQFLPTLSECMFNTTLRLSTNASYFNIPLYCYDGRVTYSLEDPEKDILDFGTLSEKVVMSMSFSVHNVNPIRISILSYEVSNDLPYATLEVTAIQSSRKIPSRPPFHLEPGSEATFRLNISYPNKLGSYLGRVTIHTSFDRQLHIPVQYKTAMGTLQLIPDKITFEPTFPYGSSSVTLLAKSIAVLPVEVASVTTVPEDARIYIRNSWGKFPRLKPNTLNEVGNLIFEPLLGEEESIYLGVRGEVWLDTPLPNSSGELRDLSNDTQWFSDLWSIWSALLDQGLTTLSLGLKLTTDVATEHMVPAHATLHWPKLVSTSMLKFPVTLVGNSSTEVVEVRNPSLVPLMIEPLLLEQCSHPQSIADILADSFDQSLHSLDFPKANSGPFSLTLRSPSTPGHHIIQPNAEPLQIAVAFTPKVGQPSSGLLLIRNNLTVLDYVVLYGQSNHRVLTLEGVAPGTDAIVFEFTSQHLDRCQGVHTVAESVQLTRTLKLHNSGTNPITITAVTVGMSGCAEHGFSVTRCNKEFTLQPDKWKKIDVSFTPDFTLSRVTNTLRVHTSLGSELLFPLVATLPHHLLATCYSSRPRADWEKTLSMVAFPFWFLLLVVLVALAILQSNVYFRTRGNQMDTPIQPTGGRVFDFTDITRKPILTADRVSAPCVSSQVDTPTSSDATGQVTMHGYYKQQQKPEGHIISVPTAAAGTCGQTQTHAQSELRSRPSHTRAVASKNYNVVAPLKSSTPDPATFQATPPANVGTNQKPSPAAGRETSSVTERLVVGPVSTDKVLKPQLSTGEAQPAQQQQQQQGPPSSSLTSEVSKPKVVVVPLVPLRKTKGVRKVASRKSGTHVPSADSSSLAVETKTDQLYRKESEMSIKSSDSDSSGDKQEEREDVTAVQNSRGLDTVARIEDSSSSKSFIPLTKEPGTGQTVPMVIPEDSPQVAASETQPHHQKGTEKVTVQKLRGRKLRQYQKKEEKLRRREVERSKVNLGVCQADGQKLASDDVFVPAATVQGNRSGKTVDKSLVGGGHTSSESSPSPLLRVESGSKDLSEGLESTLTQSMESTKGQKDKLEQDLESSQESHPSTSSPEDRSGEEVVPAVPSSAVRTRTKVTRHLDDLSTVAESVQIQLAHSNSVTANEILNEGKNAGKAAEDDGDQSDGENAQGVGDQTEGRKNELFHEPHVDVKVVELTVEEDESKNPRFTEPAERPQTLHIDAAPFADTSQDVTVSQEQSEEGHVSLSPPRIARIGPTSPHELAMSLLSTNPALVRRTKHKDETGEEVDEVKRATSGKQTIKPSVSAGSDHQPPPPPTVHHHVMPVERSPLKSNVVRPSFSPDAPVFIPTEFTPTVVSNPMRPRYVGPQEQYQGYGFTGFEDHYRPLQPNAPVQHAHTQRKSYPSAPTVGRPSFPYMDQASYEDMEGGDQCSSYPGYDSDDQPTSHLSGRTMHQRVHNVHLEMHGRPRTIPGLPRSDYQPPEVNRMFASQQQQHLYSQSRMGPPGFQGPPAALWDDHIPAARQPQQPHHFPPMHLEEDVRRGPALLLRSHGRRSVDSMTSLHNPPLRASSAQYVPVHQGVGGGGGGINLWDTHRNLMDMGTIPSEQYTPVFQRPVYSSAVIQRTYSEGSDLGGEMLPDLNSSINTPLSSRAPGSVVSTNESPSQGGRGGGGRDEPTEERSHWSTESSSSSAWPSTIWSTPSPLMSSQDSLTTSSSTIGGRTYGLFESSGIWGNNSFSWVQPKEQKK